MKLLIKTLMLISVFSFLIACQKEDDTETTTAPYDCIFEQIDEDMDGLIDETERSIMDDCLTNRITVKEDIEANLIGEW